MNEEGRPDRVLYGRRSGKPLAAYQRQLLRDVLPHLALDISRPVDLGSAFPPSCGGNWLEIGFGGGEHLVAAACRHPAIGFIGCEPFLNGMARALADLTAADLNNVRLHGGDAGALLDALPPASIDRVFLFYPDPWPKRRQRKRRFVSARNLARLARVMRPGAELRFATDIDDYCGWTLAEVARSPAFAWTARNARDWQAPWSDWTRTRYEAKAVAAGRRPCYITIVRTDAAAVAPPVHS